MLISVLFILVVLASLTTLAAHFMNPPRDNSFDEVHRFTRRNKNLWVVVTILFILAAGLAKIGGFPQLWFTVLGIAYVAVAVATVLKALFHTRQYTRTLINQPRTRQ